MAYEIREHRLEVSHATLHLGSRRLLIQVYPTRLCDKCHRDERQRIAHLTDDKRDFILTVGAIRILIHHSHQRLDLGRLQHVSRAHGAFAIRTTRRLFRAPFMIAFRTHGIGIDNFGRIHRFRCLFCL